MADRLRVQTQAGVDQDQGQGEERERGLIRDVLIIALATGVSRLFGLARDAVIADRFGASAAYDAYIIAFFIPHMLRQLLAEGALSTAFVPIYTGYLAQGREEADRFAGSVLSLALVLFPGIVVVGALLAPFYLPFLASGFPEGKLRLTVSLTGVTMPFIGLVGLAAILMGILNGRRRFLAPALAPVLFNLGLILGAWLISPQFSRPIYGLAWGLLLGGTGMVLLQLMALSLRGRERLNLLFRLDLSHPGLRELGRMMLPAVIGLAGVQLNFLVDNKLASHLGDGAISSLQYAVRLFQLPLGLFAVSISNALLPRLAHRAALRDLSGLAENLRRGLLLGAFILLPAVAGLYALGRPTIILLFEHGRFTPTDTARTLTALNSYLVGLLPYGLVFLLTRGFYALRDTRTPMIIGLIGVAVNVALDYALYRPLGVQGLALATSLAGVVNMALLFFALERRLGERLIRPLVGDLMKMALAAGVMGALVALLSRRLAALSGSRFLLVALPGVIGLAIYSLFAFSRLGGFTRLLWEGLFSGKDRRGHRAPPGAGQG